MARMKDRNAVLGVMGLLLILCAGCSDDSGTPVPPGSETGDETTGDETTGDETTGNETGEDPVDPIGEDPGEAISLDHATALAAVESLITKHVDGIDETLTFLESSMPLENFGDLLFSEDDEDDDEHQEGEPAEGGEDIAEAGAEEEEPWELDLSGVRDFLVEMFADRMMVEATVSAADDGLSLSYAVSAEYFCAEEVEEGHEEDEGHQDDRQRNEDKCAERLANHPLRLDVMSDGEDRMNLSLKVGEDASEVFTLQLHGESIAIVANLENLGGFLAVLVDPDDFELADEMNGSLGCEIRDVAAANYIARCALPEGATAIPSGDQETFGFGFPASPEFLILELKGSDATIDADLGMEGFSVELPWQLVVEIFHDGEGWDEEVCEDEPPCEDCEVNCWTEWVEGPEAAEVEGTVTLSVPAAGGSLNYAGAEDVFHVTEMNLGSSGTVIALNGESLVQFDLNPEDGRVMNLGLAGNDQMDLEFSITPKLDFQVGVGIWDQLLEPLPDMWGLLNDETLGVRFDGDNPALSILQGEDEDPQVQVSSGQLTLWSSAMGEDLVIAEGMCMVGTDDEGMSEVDKDAQHDLFGGMIGDVCE